MASHVSMLLMIFISSTAGLIFIPPAVAAPIAQTNSVTHCVVMQPHHQLGTEREMNQLLIRSNRNQLLVIVIHVESYCEIGYLPTSHKGAPPTYFFKFDTNKRI